jgi:hypothetical protein
MSNITKNVEQLKIYNSPVYRKKIKRMVELVKTVRGIHGKIARGKLPPLKATATQKERDARQKLEQSRLTLDTIHYFAHPFSSHGSATKTSSSATQTPSTENDELPAVSR